MGDRPIISDTSITITGNLVVPAVSNDNLVKLFGYTKNQKGEIVYKADAVRPVVGLVLIQNNYGGVHDVIKLMQVKLQIGGKEGQTKTDSLQFSNTTLNFDVLIPEDKAYMSVASSDEEGFVEFAPEKGFLGTSV